MGTILNRMFKYLGNNLLGYHKHNELFGNMDARSERARNFATSLKLIHISVRQNAEKSMNMNNWIINESF